MKTVVIDRKDVTLNFDGQSVRFDQMCIPFKHIDLLVLNHRITLQTADILRLTKAEISLLFISHANDHMALTSSANAKNAQIKFAQFQAYTRHMEFAKYFISQKIRTHAEQLSHHGIHIDVQIPFEQLLQATTVETIMGIEGAFARNYFHLFFQLFPKTMHKGTRSKQPPLDPVNAVLSYWYALYYHIITVKLVSYGFEPSIGYLHKPFRTHNALSSDILELFRAHINQAVIGLFDKELLTLEDFTKKQGVYLKFEGRKKIWSEFLALCELLSPMLDSELARLRHEVCGE